MPCYIRVIVSLLCRELNSFKNWCQQESPPAWTQEAHCPPRSKCSLCCSVQWGGVEMGYPPYMGYPPDMGYPPTQTWDGVPPTQTWDGVPPYPDLRWGTPPEMLTDRHLWKQYLPAVPVILIALTDDENWKINWQFSNKQQLIKTDTSRD